MEQRAIVLPEPLLEFAHGQCLPDPKDGLAMFGPYDVGQSSHPAKISYGLVGTQAGIDKFSDFSKAWIGPLVSPGDPSRLWPIFPGFEAAFQTKWPEGPSAVFDLDPAALLKATQQGDISKRVGEVVTGFIEKIRLIKEQDEKIDVIVCVVPDIVFESCRPLSKIEEPVDTVPVKSRRRRGQAQGDLFDQLQPDVEDFEDYAPDFRRQIKARAMEHGIPIQLIRESTLELDEAAAKLSGRGLTPSSDRAWNLGTTLFYKVGGKPWRLSSVRDGVCYIGFSYRMTGKTKGSKSACCAAQMFLKNGDGVIFKGEEGVWYSPAEKTYHLTKDAARRMLEGVLNSYVKLGGKPLQEIFLHCPSSINDEEYQGFLAACPGGVKLNAVRVKKDRDTRLFRLGTRPVLRGTFWKLNDRTGFLWGAGFKPSIATYDGWETPVPLRIDLLHGNAEIIQVAQDILGLTKLNFNACRLGDAEPVTIGFSDDVGEILVSNPKAVPQPQFKFYI